MDINFSIPVTLYNYRESDNPLYSYAKLKIFYVGETPDKRLFTKDFSDQLIETLPYVPVVGYYNDETEDFVGHNRKVQHIYGVVPEDAGVEYVKEGNKEFAVCDVILYTGRKDDTGEIAQKIVGKSHSLELNPANTTYKINNDINGKLQNIEFVTGSLLGLSVLGDDEKPAFTGSEFFTVDEEIETIFEGLKQQVKDFVSHINQRGENMDFNLFESALAFIKKSYSEKASDLSAGLRQLYGDYFYIPSLFDEYVVIAYWSEETGETVFERVPYSFGEDGNVTFGTAVRVMQRYLTAEEVAQWEANASNFTNNESTVTEGENTEDETDPNFTEDENNDSEDQNNNDTVTEEDQSQAEMSELNASAEAEAQEGTANNEQVDENMSTEGNGDDGEENSQEQKQEVNTNEELNANALSDGEREELEALRQEVGEYRKIRKLELLESFSEDLASSFLDGLKETLENYSYEDLEIVLSKEFTKVSKEKTQQKQQKFVPFVHNGKNNSTSESEKDYIKRLVDQYK